MSGDLLLEWDPLAGAADLVVEDNDLATDGGLETAVLISLFTDRRADDGDVLPSGETDRRGWWGDVFPSVDGDQIGSRLWLLSRATAAEFVAQSPEIIREALQWMLDDLVSDAIDVTAELLDVNTAALAISIHRPNTNQTTYRFLYNWTAQEARRL